MTKDENVSKKTKLKKPAKTETKLQYKTVKYSLLQRFS